MKIAIACLLRGYLKLSGYDDFLRRSQSVLSNLKQKETNAVIHHIIYHEGNIGLSHQKYLQKKSSIDFIFVNVAAEFIWIDIAESDFCYPTKLSDSFSSGYKSMCRFWFDGFLRYAKGYDYLVRIDEDCILYQSNIIDIINEMDRCQSIYATPFIYGVDDSLVTVGLSELITKFQDDNGLERAYDPGFNPYTNVFFINIARISGNTIFTHFSDAVHKSGCIFINRWGDLPLWGCVLQTCFSKTDILICPQFKYFHSSIGDLVNKSGLIDSLRERWLFILVRCRKVKDIIFIES
jgi:hypothetical protein